MQATSRSRRLVLPRSQSWRLLVSSLHSKQVGIKMCDQLFWSSRRHSMWLWQSKLSLFFMDSIDRRSLPSFIFKVCRAGKCVADKESLENVQDECLFGDKALLEPELIPGTVPVDLKLTCENVLMHLLKSGKSPFAACKEKKFRSACCDSCKSKCKIWILFSSRLRSNDSVIEPVFDKIECQDSDPAICSQFAKSCDDPKANVYGIPV